MVIFLVGFMGSGKSWWGETISTAAGIPFYDLDTEIEKSAGTDIGSIFRERGETYFRLQERKALLELAERIQPGQGLNSSDNQHWHAVVATGGGTPCFMDNMKWMNEKGITVWLNPPIEELLERLEMETEKRPLLQGKAGLELSGLIQAKMEEREPFYKMARIEIKNTHIAVAEFLNKLENASDIS